MIKSIGDGWQNALGWTYTGMKLPRGEASAAFENAFFFFLNLHRQKQHIASAAPFLLLTIPKRKPF